MLLRQFLDTIHLSPKEQDIYQTVLEYHKTTASVVAEQLGRERTSTYKMMKNMVRSGFLSTTHEHGTTFFLTIPREQLWDRFQTHAQHTQQIHDQHDAILQEYQAIQGAHAFHTSVKLLSGESSIRYAYQTMERIIADEDLRLITCIANHTLQVMSGTNNTLQKMYDEFHTALQESRITVSSHLGTGLGIMERLEHSLSLDTIMEMPHANDATHIWIVGHDIFLLLFTSDPQAIHIHSPQVASLLMFVAEQMEKH